jgi:hypothetical protein
VHWELVTEALFSLNTLLKRLSFFEALSIELCLSVWSVLNNLSRLVFESSDKLKGFGSFLFTSLTGFLMSHVSLPPPKAKFYLSIATLSSSESVSTIGVS